MIGTVGIVVIAVSFQARAQNAESQDGVGLEPPASGTTITATGAITLSPIVVDTGVGVADAESDKADAGGGQEWHVEFQHATGSGGPVAGTVRVTGVQIGSETDLGGVTWRLSGSDLSGTIASVDGSMTVASFKGTISATSVGGTFTTIDGQSGSWTWEGPTPAEADAAVFETSQ
jgi:hypothetical protein